MSSDGSVYLCFHQNFNTSAPLLLTNMSHRIFVYGTLKTNEINYQHLINANNGKATFVGKGETVKKYPLVACDFKDYKLVPGLLFDDEGIGNVSICINEIQYIWYQKSHLVM